MTHLQSFAILTLEAFAICRTVSIRSQCSSSHGLHFPFTHPIWHGQPEDPPFSRSPFLWNTTQYIGSHTPGRYRLSLLLRTEPVRPILPLILISYGRFLIVIILQRYLLGRYNILRVFCCVLSLVIYYNKRRIPNLHQICMDIVPGNIMKGEMEIAKGYRVISSSETGGS